MKDISGIQVIDASEIQTSSLKVTEKIQSKYLLKFIERNLTDQNIKFTSNSYIYYSFLDSTLTYEIVIFNTNNYKDTILEPFIFEMLCDSMEGQIRYDVFFTDHYFTLYKNGKFLLFKNIKNVAQEDIDIYVSQTYKIKINSITYIDKKHLNDLKNKYKKDPKISTRYHKLIQKNSYRYFIIYLIFSFIIFSTAIIHKNTTAKEIPVQINSSKSAGQMRYTKLKKILKEHDNKTAEHIIEIFKYIKINNILLQEIVFEKAVFKLIVTHTKKNNLINFLNSYNNKSTIKSLIFDEENALYKMEIRIEL
ncbi:MAG: hypothetical protein U9Q04_02255 [Campylobacterota bacterium]|nr:hypothetical protein [Campylobacterota bacterium]